MSEIRDTETGEGTGFERWGAEAATPATPDAAGWLLEPPAPATRTPMRLAGAALAAGAVAAVVVALSTGGGGHPAPGTRQTPAQIAAAINLRPGDLPGVHSSTAAGITVGASPANAIERCLGMAPNASTAPVFASRTLVSGAGLQFASLQSTVTPTTPAAISQQATLASAGSFAPCLADALAALAYRVHGLAITGGGGAQATPLPIPASGSRAVRAILGERASMTWSVNGIDFPAFVDVYEVAVGNNAISLVALASEQPYSIATEGRVVSLLERRALTRPR